MNRSRWLLGVLIAPIAAALWLLFPAWLHPEHAVVGDWLHPDMISNHWLYLWMRDQILSGGSLVHNDRYYFPVGDYPWIAGNGSDAFAWMILGAWMPWPASMTFWAMLIVVLNGLSGSVLARTVGAKLPGCILGGALLAMSPYVAYELSCARYAQAPLFWMAFFLAAWIRLLESPSTRRGVIAGVLYAVAAFTYWYYGLWAALAGVVIFAFRPRPRALVSFIPTALLLVLPPLALFLSHWAAIPGTGDEPFPHPLAVSSGLFPGFPLWGADSSLRSIVLPLPLVVLGGLALLRRPWSWTTRGLLAGAALFYLLALGPNLIGTDGEATAIPSLYQLVYAPLGVLRRYWWPYRHVAMLTVLLVPLAAAGADWIAGRLGRLWVPVAAIVIALMPLEIAARGGTDSVKLSGFSAPAPYEELAELPGEIILELPLAPRIANTQQSLSYQWIHDKTLLHGHAMWVDRVRPSTWDAWIADSRFLSALQRAELGEAEGPMTIHPEDIAHLQSLGLSHIVLNTEFFSGALTDVVPLDNHILTSLFGEPVISDGGQIKVFALSSYTGTTSVNVPAMTLPEEAFARDGTLMPKASSRTSLGWRPMIREWAGSAPAEDAGMEEMPDMLRRKISRERRKKREALKDAP